LDKSEKDKSMKRTTFHKTEELWNARSTIKTQR